MSSRPPSVLAKADTDRALQDLSLSGIVYDTTARTVYRDLTLTLGYVLGKEADDD